MIDPVMPRELDGLAFDTTLEGRSVRFLYRVKERECSPRAITINGNARPDARVADHPYRLGGLLVPREQFTAALDREANTVEVLL